jgi:TonB family protein
MVKYRLRPFSSMKPTLSFFRVAAAVTLASAVALAQKVAPIPKDCKSPVYPEELTDSGLSGTALLAMTVNSDGSVSDPIVVTADHSAFGTAALAVVRDWKFEPAKLDGVAVAIRVHQPFDFQSPFDQRVNSLFKRKVFASISQPILSEKDFGLPLVAKRPPRPVYPAGYVAPYSHEVVDVEFIVNPEGQTMNPRVVGHYHPALTTAAIAAVAKAVYEPPQKFGQGVYVTTSLSLVFMPGSGRQRDGSGAGDFDGEPVAPEMDYGSIGIKSQLQRVIPP